MTTDYVHFTRRTAARWRHAFAALAIFPLSAVAGYALPAPPPGFGGSPGSWTFTPPANAPTIGGGAPAANGPMWRGPGPTLPSAGGGVPTSAAFRMGAGGGRALAGAVARGLIPGVGLALGVAWLASNCFERQGGQWVRTCFAPGQEPPSSDGYEYRAGGQFTPWEGPGPACDRRAGIASDGDPVNRYEFSGELFRQPEYPWVRGCVVKVVRKSDGVVVVPITTLQIESRQSSCPAGWYQTPAGCIQTPPPQTVTIEQIESEMAPKPLPDVLPGGVPYPLDPHAPFIFNPTPGDSPQGQPMRVPQGNPVPVPNTDPQQYRQPVTRWAHSPSPSEPWRMNTEPLDVIGNDPQGMTEPQPETGTTPGGSAPEKSDLCADHPDILACQKVELDTPDGEIPKTTKQITYAPETVLGGGSCPPPVPMAYGEVLDYTSTCDNLVTWVRPMVIAIAGWIAIVIIFGVGKPE